MEHPELGQSNKFKQSRITTVISETHHVSKHMGSNRTSMAK